MSLRLHRQVPGGLEPSRAEPADWRRSLRARRWRAARLDNPEVEPVGPAGAILFFGALAVLTFVLLVLGYGTHFWG